MEIIVATHLPDYITIIKKTAIELHLKIVTNQLTGQYRGVIS